MHSGLEDLKAGTLILYRTTESENGLKLGLVSFVYRNTLQRTATHCNALQRIAEQLNLKSA